MKSHKHHPVLLHPPPSATRQALSLVLPCAYAPGKPTQVAQAAFGFWCLHRSPNGWSTHTCGRQWPPLQFWWLECLRLSLLHRWDYHSVVFHARHSLDLPRTILNILEFVQQLSPTNATFLARLKTSGSFEGCTSG